MSATQTAHPAFPFPQFALNRYWTITEDGDITANLTFHYLNDPMGTNDVPATADENSFELLRYTTVFTEGNGTVDTSANTSTATNISEFSDWTLADTAAIFGATPTPTPTPSAVIGDRVWDDNDADGVQDMGEAGMSGVLFTASPD
jgi:hypothetical protein